MITDKKLTAEKNQKYQSRYLR